MVLTSPDKAGGFSGVGIISWRFGGIGGPRENSTTFCQQKHVEPAGLQKILSDFFVNISSTWATKKKPSDIPLYWLGNMNPYKGLWNDPYI